MGRPAPTLLAALLLAVPSAAQVATSPNFDLDGWEVQGAGRGLCSPGHGSIAAWNPLGEVGLASVGFRADVGFLAVHDPLASDRPSILAVAPAFGPAGGGTTITLCGLRFVAQGLAGPVAVEVGGVAATNVTVVSDAILTADVPAGSFGPQALSVQTSLGAVSLAGGFVCTPAVLTSPIAWRTGALEIRNLGPLGAQFLTNYSPNTTSIPLGAFGTLLIGPSPLILAVSGAYPAPLGDHLVALVVPDDASLVGVALHFQTAAILSLVPLDVRLVNRSSTLLR